MTFLDMGMRAANDPIRVDSVIQIKLTHKEKSKFIEYAKAKHRGNVSHAGRAVIMSCLDPATENVALTA